MALNLRQFKWHDAEEALKKFLNERPLRISDDGNQALLCNLEEKVVAILKIYKDEDFVSLHLRASLTPSLAGYISAIVGVVVPMTIDEMFEYNFDGDMVIGNDALSFAADNIHDLWFGFKDKKTGKKFDRPELLN